MTRNQEHLAAFVVGLMVGIIVGVALAPCPAHAGRLSGHVAVHEPISADACDSLGLTAKPVRVHARIMAGTVKAWEDSVACAPGQSWELAYPALDPGSYQASSWTTKATNALLGCPDVITITVEAPTPAYSIIFGWSTVGAVRDNRSGRVIGAAEMLRRLEACEQARP